MEREGCPAEYLYIILKGEIELYKKLPQLYERSCPVHELEARLVNITEKKPLQLFVDPKDAGKKYQGACIGVLGGSETLAGEDAALHKQP